MSDTTANLRRKISSASELQSVVRTMKALAASSIGQYEQSVRALSDYYRTVELGLSACFRQPAAAASMAKGAGYVATTSAGVVVFGSDQGLVGQFNEVVVDRAIKLLATLPGQARVWAVGERVRARLADSGVLLAGLFAVPSSVQAITPLISQILVHSAAQPGDQAPSELHLVHNRPGNAAAGSGYAPVTQRLLPLDAVWRGTMAGLAWPTSNAPEVMMGDTAATLSALVREYVFVSLFRACAESLASENASRLAAMERADRNIDELLEGFHGTFHRLRQRGIDAELFDVVSGFEALSEDSGRTGSR